MLKLLVAILPTLLLTLYGQIIIKWRVSALFAKQKEPMAIQARLLAYLLDPGILSAVGSSFLAALAWLYVAERFPISTAYPVFVGLLFACVLVASAFFLKEHISMQQLAGIGLILLGVIVASTSRAIL